MAFSCVLWQGAYAENDFLGANMFGTQTFGRREAVTRVCKPGLCVRTRVLGFLKRKTLVLTCSTNVQANVEISVHYNRV